MKLSHSRYIVILAIILFVSFNINAQYYLDGLASHIVLIETNNAEGQGILVTTDEPYLGQIYLITSRSIFTKNATYSGDDANVDFIDETVILSHYFKNIENKFLTENDQYCEEKNPLNIRFNAKVLFDSTDCINRIDSSDAVFIKLYDRSQSIDEKFISFGGVCSLRPFVHISKRIDNIYTKTELNEIYLFAEVPEQIKPYLMDIEIIQNTQGQNVIPLMGTNYVSRVLFKVENEHVLYYGIANKDQEIFKVNMNELFKN